MAADDPLRLGPRWQAVQTAVRAGHAAVTGDEPRTLARLLHASDHWRVLAHWFEQASFFDIETSGLDVRSVVTLVCCLHRGRLYRFVRGENLDEFLDLLQEIKLMVSFNGASFDVPRIEDLFHVPEFPCAHVDLRWMCYHRGWRGGLKALERQLGLQRPADLEGVDGFQAVQLWEQWERHGDRAARHRLERYCAADTVTLQRLAAELLTAHGCGVTIPALETLWEVVTAACPTPPGVTFAAPAPPPAAPAPAAAAVCAAVRAACEGAHTRAERQQRLRARWRAMQNQP